MDSAPGWFSGSVRMSGFDVAAAVILALSMLLGFYRGFVQQILSLGILVLALFVAIKFAGVPPTLLPDIQWGGIWLGGSELQWAGMLALLFLSVLILGRLVNRFVFNTLRRSFISMPDRFLGGVFGLVRGGIIIVVLVLLAGLTALPFSDSWRGSLLIPEFERLAQYLACYIPGQYRGTHYACTLP